MGATEGDYDIDLLCLLWEQSCWTLSEVPKPGWATESPGGFKKRRGGKGLGLHLLNPNEPQWSLGIIVMLCMFENFWTRWSLGSSSRSRAICLPGRTRVCCSYIPHVSKSGCATDLLGGGYLLYQNVHSKNDSPGTPGWLCRLSARLGLRS